jgi:tetratricopeptide (TPR) repeat protein
MKKHLKSLKKTLPTNHPDLANFYNNIRGLYTNMGDYSKAFSYYERDLNIFQRSLPLNHPNITTVRESIEIVKEKL